MDAFKKDLIEKYVENEVKSTEPLTVFIDDMRYGIEYEVLLSLKFLFKNIKVYPIYVEAGTLLREKRAGT